MTASGAFGAALLLDFDGTLAPIAPNPDAVRVADELPGLLVDLRDRLGGALAIVTGRPIADIDRFLPGLALDVCGLHGLDRRVGGRHVSPALPSLAAEVAELRAALASCPGTLVEDKGVGVAVHWRQAPACEAEARRAIDRVAERLGTAYRLQEGKAVREIVPAEAGKGKAAAHLSTLPPYAGRPAVFVGDDVTDEAAFRSVQEAGGLGVKIGTGETAARLRLASPADLQVRLAAWRHDGAGPQGWPSA